MAALMGFNVKHCSSALLDQSQGTASCSLAPVQCPQPHGPAQVTTGESSTSPAWITRHSLCACITHHSLCACSSSRQCSHVHRVRRRCCGPDPDGVTQESSTAGSGTDGTEPAEDGCLPKRFTALQVSGSQQSNATTAIPHPASLCST